MSHVPTSSVVPDAYDRPGQSVVMSTGPLIGLSLLQAGLFLVPLIVLGYAIGWPASLRLPAEKALLLIAREAAAVQIGYWAYLVTSLAMIPLAVALRAYAHSQGVRGLMVDTAALLGTAAGVFKMLGIVRWLTAIPALAELYGSTKDPVTKAAIEVSYILLNGYAGAVGELLGVQLVNGVWLILTGIIIFTCGLRWTGIVGTAIGALLVATCARTFLPQAAMLQALGPPLALFWFPMLAIAVWRRR